MQIYDYIYKFRDNHYIYIGDGLISFHTDEESKVINADGKLILELLMGGRLFDIVPGLVPPA